MSRRKYADYIFRSYRKRKFLNFLACAALCALTGLALAPLVSVFALQAFFAQ